MRVSWWFGAAVLVVWCGPALAWPGEVAWPTFYRAGPARQYAVLDELDRGAVLDVLSCDSGWCRVQSGRSTGYVEQAALLPPADVPAKPPVPGPAGCFESRETGYGKGEVYRYCPR